MTPALSQKNHLTLIRKYSGGTIQFLAYIAGVVGFAIVFFGSAKLVSAPIGFIALGLIAAAFIVYGGSYFSARLFKIKRAAKYSAVQSGVFTLVLFGLFATLILPPLVPKSEQFTATPDDGVEYWDLSTGSTIAIRKYEAKGEESLTPIIYLHGGPGAYSVMWEPTMNVMSQMRKTGRDVYVYDQVGGGLSERLADITEYSLARHIEDLRAIREEIGAEKVIILASSFGATLTTNYMAKYPNDFAAVIFTGPGPIYKPDWENKSDGSLDDKLSPNEKNAFDKMIERPRLFTALILSEINPAAASNFASERELGSFFDKIANKFYLAAALCKSSPINSQSNGYGFWSNRMTGKTLNDRNDDPKSILQTNSTPILVLRGECDYKDKAVAEQYVSVFPNASFREIKNAGHMLYQEQPEEYLKAVLEFIAKNLGKMSIE